MRPVSQGTVASSLRQANPNGDAGKAGKAADGSAAHRQFFAGGTVGVLYC